MQVKKRKRRLDDICVEMYPEYSKNVVQSWILQGTTQEAPEQEYLCQGMPL